MTDKDTFIDAVQRCLELPEAVRESARQLIGIEKHSFDQSYIDFLDTQIRLSPRGPSWAARLKKRREGLLRFRDQTLLRGRIQVGSDDYAVEVDPKVAAVVYWERYEGIRADT